ncbi:MAG: hypothetical protein N2044_05730 [Cyclobacteriaceae bacterium]|nr:hypothetical protein [Cyclobacteriaceae bacterium]MCX7637333.1 hypothetical protein [Cyclobacteriaceae bacterium]
MTEIKLSSSGIISGFIYAILVVTAVYLFFSKESEMSVCLLAIALGLSPFEHSSNWSERPTWQKVWLFVHLSLALAGLAFLLFA